VAGKNTAALAGEFLVAGELSRREYLVSITMGNAKAVDIHAEYTDVEGRRIRISIDVKASRYKTSWPVTKVEKDIYYVFVYLQNVERLKSESSSNKNTPPQYFIVSGNEILKCDLLTKWTNMSGVKYADLNKADYIERWDKLLSPS